MKYLPSVLVAILVAGAAYALCGDGILYGAAFLVLGFLAIHLLERLLIGKDVDDQ